MRYKNSFFKASLNFEISFSKTCYRTITKFSDLSYE